jgi:hypothetical protein
VFFKKKNLTKTIFPRVKWMYPFYCSTSDTSCEVVTFKDLYKMEFKLFESPFWVMFYLISIFFFVNHMSEGWSKITNSSPRIPRSHKVGVSFNVYICTLSKIFKERLSTFEDVRNVVS